MGYRYNGEEINFRLKTKKIKVPVTFRCPRCHDKVRTTISLRDALEDYAECTCTRPDCGIENVHVRVWLNLDEVRARNTDD